jgi:hypothetical protein
VTRALALVPLLALTGACRSGTSEVPRVSPANSAVPGGNAPVSAPVEDTDVVAVQDPNLATVHSPTESPAPVGGAACSPIGTHARAVVSEGSYPCQCAATASGAGEWRCDRGAMRVMGPMPPPDFTA